MKEIGYILIIIGAITVIAGVFFLLAGRVSWLGNLPGDIHVKGKNWVFSFPLVTCILISVLLTIVLNIMLRVFRR